MSLTTYLAIFCVSITTLIIYLRRRFTYWSRKGVPGPNFIEYEAFTGVHHEYTLEAVKKWGRVYGTYTGFQRSIAINEPDLLRDIMVKDFNIMPDHKHFHVGSSKIGQSLFFMPGDDDWKRVRSILTPVFTSGKLRAMLGHIGGIADKFVESLTDLSKKGKPVDMRNYVGAFTMDVICACGYGIQADTINNPDHPIVTNAKRVLGFNGGLSIVLSALTPGLARLLRLEPFDIKAVKYFDGLTKQILNERKVNNKSTANDKSKRRTDFIQLILDSEKSDKELGYHLGSEGEADNESTTGGQQLAKKSVGTLTQDETIAQGLIFFLAGYDTTSASITNALHFLSKHPDCQQRLYEELRSCDEFTYEKLSQLKYLNAVINETLRLAPSLTRIQRECLSDYKLGNTGITIPAGTSVEIYPYAIHRDPDLWPNPNDFIPDRFLEPTHHPYAYIPFGGGPRVCIGQRFVLQEMRMCLAKLISKLEFNMCDETKIEYFTSNILISPKELMLDIKTRS